MGVTAILVLFDESTFYREGLRNLQVCADAFAMPGVTAIFVINAE